MYIEQLKSGRWALCRDDSTIIKTFHSMLGATRYRHTTNRILEQAETDGPRIFMSAKESPING